MTFEEGGRTIMLDGVVLAFGEGLRDAWRGGGFAYILATMPAPQHEALFVVEVSSQRTVACIPPPQGWRLCRLTDHPRGPSVIASNQKFEDWHFVIDPRAGTLRQTVPSR